MRQPFRNKFAGVTCSICGQTIAVGAEFSWDRSAKARGEKAMKWHLACDKDGKLAAMNNGFGEGEEEEPAPAPKPKPEAQPAPWLQGFADAMLPLIEGKLAGKTDRAEVEEIVKGMLEGRATPVTVTIKNPVTGTETKIGVQHKQFPDLLNLCQVRHEDDDTHLNILLTGPAGTGKTRAAVEIAKALDRPFYFTGAINTEYKLLGFIDAQGRVICPAFRKAYVEGGVFLFDEIWRSLPAALMPFNTALAGTRCDFPDGCFERHPDFLCLGADNALGLGGDAKYNGYKQDASVLDRFVPYKWDIDEALEEHIAKHPAWCARIRYLRANAERKGLDVLITPRAARSGASMLRQGVAQTDVENMLIASRMKPEQWRNIQ